ncbi:MAG: formate dehydrogenase [Methylocystaceae bacterium]|nr:formate dehydrogenase [Methylocystaceae bacterium]
MKPVKVYIPQDSAALSVGADEVALSVQERAESLNIPLQIVRNGSRGMLWLEPLLEVESKDGRIAFGPVSVEDIDALFEKKFWESREHPLCLGLTEEIPFFKKQERLTFARCGVTDPLNIEEYQKYDGFLGLKNALKMTPQAVCLEVRESGLRGRGGAGFPTGIKWQTVLEAESDEKYICCNADEGDSGTFADRMIMEGDPFSLIEGMVIAGYGVGAQEGLIYLRSEYPYAINILEKAIQIATDNNWLGDNIQGSGFSFSLEVRKGAGAYICGEETSMLESLEGKRGLVRSKPPIPALSGFMGKPTVVNNVLSLTTVPIILAKGASYYESFGIGRSRGTQPFQLGGNVKQGGLIEKAFGLTLRDLIYDYGGGTRTGRNVRTVQVGGPLGAYLGEDQFDLALGYEEMSAGGGMLGHGGVVVFDDTVNMAQQARFAFEFCAVESCGKCTPCRIGAQRGLETMDKVIAGEDVSENLNLLDDLCELMKDGSLCAMGGLTPLPVESAIRNFPNDFNSDNDSRK